MQLVIAEKPSVARSISEVIGATEISDGYMEGNGYVVSWCVGHLVELAQPESYGEQWKKWTYESLPVKPEKWQYEVKPDTKAQYDILFRLMHRKDVTGPPRSVLPMPDGRANLSSVWCMKWQAVTSRSNACGFPQWRKAQSGKGLHIYSRGAITITCTIPHCAGRRRTGLWASTAQGCLPSCMAEKS